MINAKLLESLERLIEDWSSNCVTEEWFPNVEWGDNTTQYLALSVHNMLLAIEDSEYSLKDSMVDRH